MKKGYAHPSIPIIQGAGKIWIIQFNNFLLVYDRFLVILHFRKNNTTVMANTTGPWCTQLLSLLCIMVLIRNSTKHFINVVHFEKKRKYVHIYVFEGFRHRTQLFFFSKISFETPRIIAQGTTYSYSRDPLEHHLRHCHVVLNYSLNPLPYDCIKGTLWCFQ